jgi:hypothetical protein
VVIVDIDGVVTNTASLHAAAAAKCGWHQGIHLGGAGTMTTTSDHQWDSGMSAASEQRPRLYALLRRWPTVLGVGVAALTLSDFDDGREFAIVLLIASLGYLAIAVLERPQATWWVLIGLLAGVVCLRLLNIAPGPVLAVAAVVMTIVGLVRGSLRRLWLPALQAPATLIFGAVAFIAIAAGYQVGSTLVAVGLLAHTVWDLVHLRARAIVSPSLAEWCAVLDTLIAVGILVLVWR